MIRYARLLMHPTRAGRSPVQGLLPRQVLDLVDVGSVKWQTYADQSRPPLRWVYGSESRRLRVIESGKFDPFDSITVVS